jgi:hypothetical protein
MPDGVPDLPQDIQHACSVGITSGATFAVDGVQSPLAASSSYLRAAGRSAYSRARWSASRTPAVTTALNRMLLDGQAAISATTQALMIASGAPWVVLERREVSSRRCAAAATGLPMSASCRLLQHGIEARTTRNTALLALAADLPAPGAPRQPVGAVGPGRQPPLPHRHLRCPHRAGCAEPLLLTPNRRRAGLRRRVPATAKAERRLGPTDPP